MRRAPPDGGNKGPSRFVSAGPLAWPLPRVACRTSFDKRTRLAPLLAGTQRVRRGARVHLRASAPRLCRSRACGASRPRRWCVRRAARFPRSCAPRASRLSALPAAQTTPLVAGLTVAAAALTARSAIQYYQVWKVTPRLRKFYEGGFEATMDKREAALILGLRCVRRQRSSASPKVPARAALTPRRRRRESAARNERKVKEAHRRIMIANHPDSGGSDYIASKVNEAKDVMLGKKGGSNTNF